MVFVPLLEFGCQSRVRDGDGGHRPCRIGAWRGLRHDATGAGLGGSSLGQIGGWELRVDVVRESQMRLP